MRKTELLAWAAGFFDGEGTSSVQTVKQTSGNTYKYPSVSLSQNEEQPLQRFIDAVGVGRVLGPYPGRPKIRHWRVVGSKAEDVMVKLLPYLSEPKRAQWERVLEEVTPVVV